MNHREDSRKRMELPEEDFLDIAEQLRTLAAKLEAAAAGGEGWAEDEIRNIFQEMEDIFSTLGNLFVNLRYEEFLGGMRKSWRRISHQFAPIRDAGREFLSVFKDAMSEKSRSVDPEESKPVGGDSFLTDEKAREIADVYLVLTTDGIDETAAFETAGRWGGAFLDPYAKFKQATEGDSMSAFRMAGAYLKSGK